MTLIDRLLGVHLASGRGGAPCCVDSALGTVSYAALHRAAGGYAAQLRERGVPVGARGVVVADDSVEAVIAIFGLWWRGCVPVPVSPLLPVSDVAFVAADCDARVAHLGVPPDLRAAIEAELHAVVCVGDDLARRALAGLAGAIEAHAPARGEVVLIQYTSGSTGVPRGVRHGLEGVDAVLSGFGAILDLRPDDVVLSTAKLTFGYGFGNSLLFPFAAGARTVLSRGAVDPYVLSGALREHRPTVLCSVPRVYSGLVRLCEAGDDVPLGSVRLAVSAGEHLPPGLAEAFMRVFGVPLVNGLGATEVLHIVVGTRPPRPRAGSVGHPVSGVEATVRGESGCPLPDGTEGRLHIAGRSVALGYVDRPDAEAATFADGGAYTGDIVIRSEDGDIDYLCRADDLLNLGGNKVAPAEIEAVVRAVPGVVDCAVVGELDGEGLQQAVAHVVSDGAVDEAALHRRIKGAQRAALPSFKRARRVELHERLPVTSTGKLARYKLREPIVG